jgi:hypothetical protein
MSVNYQIGQVLYLVSHKQNSLIPVQVQEITQKTTIEGTDTAYVVMAPNGQGPYVLSELDVEVHTDPSGVAQILKKIANESIDLMVKNAMSVAVEQYGRDGSNSILREPMIPAKKKKKSTPPELPKAKKAESKQSKTGNKKIDDVPEPAKIRSVTMPNGERVSAG